MTDDLITTDYVDDPVVMLPSRRIWMAGIVVVLRYTGTQWLVWEIRLGVENCYIPPAPDS